MGRPAVGLYIIIEWLLESLEAVPNGTKSATRGRADQTA